MKNKIIVASLAAVVIIVAISCGLFGSKRTKEFNIQGQWTIDSIANRSSDSSKNIGLLAVAISEKDSMPVGVQFNADSSFGYMHSSDSNAGKYYLAEDQTSLFIKEDSVTHQFNFLSKSDSAISLLSVDSIYYYLRRK